MTIEASTADNPPSLWAALTVPALAVLGLFFTFYPMLLTGFTHMRGTPADPRLANYLMEHTYRWALREPPHQDLWSPPFFYPELNVGAYSDIYLTAGPIYWPWRAMGFSPETAFQITYLLAALLNYLLFWYFARRCLEFPTELAAFAAFLFAFGSPRLVHTDHFQLFLQFYTIGCLIALHRLFAEPPSEHPAVWIAIFFVCLVAQLYASFYLGWFLVLGLGVVLLWSLTLAEFRQRLVNLLCHHYLSLILWSGLAALALADMGRHYLDAARATGYQPEEQILMGMPTGLSWLSRGPDCWLRLSAPLVPPERWPEVEQAISAGLAAYGLAFLAVFRNRQHRLVMVLLAASLSLVLMLTAFRPSFGLWTFLYPLVPGGQAIRSTARVIMLLLIPLSLAAAWGLGYVAQRYGRLPALLLAILCILEQGQWQVSYDLRLQQRQLAEVARHIPPGSQAFLLANAEDTPVVQVLATTTLAMRAQLESGVPTLNGYSGRWPPLWQEQLVLIPVTDLQDRLDRINVLLAAYGLGDATMTPVRIQVPELGDCYLFVIGNAISR